MDSQLEEPATKVKIDPAASLCLVDIVLESSGDEDGVNHESDADGPLLSELQLRRYLRWAEIALAAQQHQKQSAHAAQVAAKSAALVGEVIDLSPPPLIDLTQPGATLSPPPPAVFHAPPRWKGRHPNATRVAQQCVGRILAHQTVVAASPASAPAAASLSASASATASASDAVPAVPSPPPSPFADESLHRRWTALLSALQSAQQELTAKQPKPNYTPIRRADTKPAAATTRPAPYHAK
jgi:hypothetical protein